MPMTRSNCCRCWERIKVRSPPRIWMHTWTSSPFASTAGNRAVGECSSIACWKMPSQHSQRDIGLQEPTKQHQNTTCSGYCTKAATPLSAICYEVCAHLAHLLRNCTRCVFCVARKRAVLHLSYSSLKLSAIIDNLLDPGSTRHEGAHVVGAQYNLCRDRSKSRGLLQIGRASCRER